MTYFIDIDNTICTQEKNYADAKPMPDRIEKFNRLYDNHKVIYWTSRGSTTGIDWGEVTRNQLTQWGVKYHEVRFGKPQYDVWIDDKSLKPEEV